LIYISALILDDLVHRFSFVETNNNKYKLETSIKNTRTSNSNSSNSSNSNSKNKYKKQTVTIKQLLWCFVAVQYSLFLERFVNKRQTGTLQFGSGRERREEKR